MDSNMYKRFKMDDATATVARVASVFVVPAQLSEDAHD
jgi:hypothetical protein